MKDQFDSNSEEKKPKSEKKTLKWFSWIPIVIMLVVLAILMPLLINSAAELQNQKESALLKQEKWNTTKNGLVNINNELTEKNANLEEKNKGLNSLADSRLKEKDNALAKAEKEKTYGKSMEQLAQSHAAKFQKQRIETNQLSEKLRTEKVKTSSNSKKNEKLEKWAKNYKNIIEKQKAEIARISEAFERFQEKYHKK